MGALAAVLVCLAAGAGAVAPGTRLAATEPAAPAEPAGAGDAPAPSSGTPEPAPPPDLSGAGEGTVVTLPDDEPGPPAAPPTALAPSSHLLVVRELSLRLLGDTTFRHDDADVVEVWGQARLRLDHRATDRLRLVAEARARWGFTGKDTAPGTTFWLYNARAPTFVGLAELREAFVDWNDGPLAVRFGEQIFVWGKNELLPAADVLSPVDLRYDPTRALSDQRSVKQPVLALDARVGHDGAGVELVLVPFFAPARARLVGGDFALLRSGSPEARALQAMPTLGGLEVADELGQAFAGTGGPTASPANVAAALRAGARAGALDVAVTVYRGWETTPFVRLDPQLRGLLDTVVAAGGDARALLADPALAMLAAQQAAALSARVASGAELVTVDHRRLWVAAVEAEAPLGDVLVRADLGFAPARTLYSSRLEPFERPELQGALGLEWTRGEAWYVAVTAFGVGIWHPPSDARVLGVERTDVAAVPRDLALRWGFGGTARWREPSRWSAELTGVYSVAPGDWMGQATVGWLAAEPHDLRVGVLLAGGPAGTLGGAYGRNDYLFVEYRAAW